MDPIGLPQFNFFNEYDVLKNIGLFEMKHEYKFTKLYIKKYKVSWKRFKLVGMTYIETNLIDVSIKILSVTSLNSISFNTRMISSKILF
jgi:hypothetical protein